MMMVMIGFNPEQLSDFKIDRCTFGLAVLKFRIRSCIQYGIMQLQA